MAYKRKTRDEWRAYIWYSPTHGWEHELTEDTFKEAKEQVKTYRANCPYPVKIVYKRVKINETATA